MLNKRLSEDNVYENSLQCQELRFNIVKCNPYFCKYADLDGTKDFKKINKRELIKPFALCYSSKNRVERFNVDCFRTNTSTDINVEKVSVKISINQIVSFLSMIRNTSNILTEKYIEKIKKDEQMNHGRQNVNNSVAMKTAFDNYDNSMDEAKKIKETIEVFSNRYYQVPKKKINTNCEIEDEADETDALSTKDVNLAKLKSPIRMVSTWLTQPLEQKQHEGRGKEEYIRPCRN